MEPNLYVCDGIYSNNLKTIYDNFIKQILRQQSCHIEQHFKTNQMFIGKLQVELFKKNIRNVNLKKIKKF